MNTLTDFHFLRPWWLLGLLLLAVLLWRLYRQKLHQGDWASVCDPWLLPHVLINRPDRARRFGVALLGLSGVLALLALAGPVWEREQTPAFRNEQALVIALDLSRSMDAADIKPSRLERARFKITDLLKARKDGQTALVAYAGDAFTVTPLTDDAETIRAQLGALSTVIMPEQGNRADLALQQSAKLLSQAGLRDGHVLLISNGVDGNASRQAAEQLRSQGYSVSVLGVGTAQGAPVTIPDGGFLKDASGAIVVPKLDSAALQALATAGGGRYLPVTSDNSDVLALAQLFDGSLPQGADASSQTRLEQWQEQGPWLLLLLLPLAALAFRRGLLVTAWLALALPWPDDAAAWDWHDLWQTQDQQAQQAMQQQNYAEAAERFQDPAWKGAAYYRAGQYDKAAEAMTGLDDAEALYNRGNALAQARQYQDAIVAYSRSLKKNPEHADARHNKDLVEQQLQQQNSQKDQDQSKNGQDQQDKSDNSQGKPQPSEPEHDDQTGQDSAQAQPTSPPKPDIQQAPPAPDQPVGKDDKQPARAVTGKPDETQQANEAWLKRIPDDPGGLLKRKFQYQYQQRHRAPTQATHGKQHGFRLDLHFHSFP